MVKMEKYKKTESARIDLKIGVRCVAVSRTNGGPEKISTTQRNSPDDTRSTLSRGALGPRPPGGGPVRARARARARALSPRTFFNKDTL